MLGIADKCPVHRTLMRGFEIVTDIGSGAAPLAGRARRPACARHGGGLPRLTWAAAMADSAAIVARGERLVRKRLLLAAGAALAVAATPAGAFGLRTHLYIADQVWQDLADCRVTDPRPAISRSPPRPAARSAAIAASSSPARSAPTSSPTCWSASRSSIPASPAAGRRTTGSNHLLANARRDDELAFAWGYAMHYRRRRLRPLLRQQLCRRRVRDRRGPHQGDRAAPLPARKIYRPASRLSRSTRRSCASPPPSSRPSSIQYDYGAGGGPRVGDFYASAAADPAGLRPRGDAAAARRRRRRRRSMTILDHARPRPRRARRGRRARRRPSGPGSTPRSPPRARPSGAGRCRRRTR